MKRKVYYGIIAFAVVIFIVSSILSDKNATNEWRDNVEFNGVIQNIEYLKSGKEFYMMINDEWYSFLYDRSILDGDYIGCEIKKERGENGFWLEQKGNTDDFRFFNNNGGLLKDNSTLYKLKK